MITKYWIYFQNKILDSNIDLINYFTLNKYLHIYFFTFATIKLIEFSPLATLNTAYAIIRAQFHRNIFRILLVVAIVACLSVAYIQNAHDSPHLYFS